MFKRLLWLGVGIGIGVVVVRTVTRKARAFSPAGLAGSAQEAIGYTAGSVRSFFDDLRDGMAEREDDIRTHFTDGEALDAPDQPWARGVGTRFNEFKQQLADSGESPRDAVYPDPYGDSPPSAGRRMRHDEDR